MIRFYIDQNNTPRLEQFETAPTVYLDHWAIRLFSDDLHLQNEFVSALKSCSGTLMLSWLNLFEFTQVEDRQAHKRAEDFVYRLLPNIFFMEVIPFDVIERENKLLSGGEPISPHADPDLLRVFSELGTNSLSGFSTDGLFTPMHGSDTQEDMELLADKIVEGWQNQRDEHKESDSFQKIIRKPPKGPVFQHNTYSVLCELARTFIVEKTLKLTRNHAIDLLHSVVPTSYCDHALLDGHWQDKVSRIQTRFDSEKMNVPLARVHSNKGTGIQQFLDALANVNGS